MRKIIGAILAGVIMTATLFVNNSKDCYFLEGCKVVESQNGVIAIEDARGNIWEYESDKYVLYDRVDLKMHSNHTDTIEDDIILEIKPAL